MPNAVWFGFPSAPPATKSRTDDETDVCTTCALDESMYAFAGIQNTQDDWPVEDWLPITVKLSLQEANFLIRTLLLQNGASRAYPAVADSLAHTEKAPRLDARGASYGSHKRSEPPARGAYEFDQR
jgi:hypothetical protein